MGFQVLVDGETYNHVDTWGPIEIADSFVARSNKLTSTSGNGEAKLYVGEQSERLRKFFGRRRFKIRAFLDRDELLTFFAAMKEKYTKDALKYRSGLDLPKLWDDRFAQLKGQVSRFVWFDVAEQIAGGPRRCYVKGSGRYDLLRELPLPNAAYITIEKLQSTSGELVYKFSLNLSETGNVPASKSHADLLTRDEAERRIVVEIETDPDLTATQKEQLIAARRGQGHYRLNLLESCGGFCPLSLVDDPELLVASHIKPWRSSSNFERLDPFNGLLLSPTFDLLFDHGLITFDDDCRIRVSRQLGDANSRKLGLINGALFSKLPLLGDGQANRRSYMRYHRENIFLAS